VDQSARRAASLRARSRTVTVRWCRSTYQATIVPLPQETILQTLALATTYLTSVPATDVNLQVTPGFAAFYDWQGMIQVEYVL